MKLKQLRTAGQLGLAGCTSEVRLYGLGAVALVDVASDIDVALRTWENVGSAARNRAELEQGE